MNQPNLNWIKRDPVAHAWHQDGSRYLIARQVTNNRTNVTTWDCAAVQVRTDDEWFDLALGCECSYDAWTWDDVEFFVLLDGAMPTAKPGQEGCA